MVVLGPDEERDRSLRGAGTDGQEGRVGVSVAPRTAFVQLSSIKGRKRRRTLLNPRAWRYHSLIELSVDLRERSNMNSSATASLHTSGSMLTNSRWPPRSQIENVISVFRIEMLEG